MSESSQAMDVAPGVTPTLRVTSRSGRIQVSAWSASRILVERGGALRRLGEGDYEASAASPSGVLSVLCPEGTNVVAGTVSGPVKLKGPLGNVRVTTVSGTVEVDGAERLDVRSGSGRATIGAAGKVRAATTSADVRITSVQEAEVTTASGRVEIEDGGRLRVRSANGDVRFLARVGAAVDTIAGRITAVTPAGAAPSVLARTISGQVRNHLPAGDAPRLSLRSVSGAIEVRSADEAAT